MRKTQFQRKLIFYEMYVIWSITKFHFRSKSSQNNKTLGKGKRLEEDNPMASIPLHKFKGLKELKLNNSPTLSNQIFEIIVITSFNII